MLGRRRRRRRRSIGLVKPISFSLNKNKQKAKLNGTVTAQLNKSVNGTTSGNVNFVLNNPKAAYLLSNPLTRVLTLNSPNKSFQWQFGKRSNGVGSAAPAAPAAAPAAPAAGQSANVQPPRPVQPQPVGANPMQVALDQPLSGSFVVPAGRARASG